ncbi:hypothetical protein [Neisseria elongata]|nr:hypothetical protein [Neisseria elongata]
MTAMKTAIADWAAYRLLLTLGRIHFEDVQSLEAFVVLPARKPHLPARL